MALSLRRVAWASLASTLIASLLTTAPSPADAAPMRPKALSMTVPGGIAGLKQRALEIDKKLTPKAMDDAKPLVVVPRRDRSAKKAGPSGPPGYVPPTTVDGKKVEISPTPEPSTRAIAPLAASVNLPITVGKVFIYKEATDEWVYCSGTVVTGNFKNLVATAAHCIIDPATGNAYKYWAFVPSYNDGGIRWPYGNWVPYRVTVWYDWVDYEDPDYDYAFINVSRLDGETGEPSGLRIGDFVGGQGLTWDQPIDVTGYVFAYPHAPHLDGDKVYSGWTMKWCYGTTGMFAASQGADWHIGWGPAINSQTCAMTPGADGGPFLFQYNSNDDPLLRVGLLNTVISRVRDADGNSRYDTWSGPYFDADAKVLYDEATNLWSP
ncbi:trypsin-like serine peptidase [Microtetraspora glauca]|uniref:Serine protease n=1 Tax=Microtetraspora glauca TaxID=1996 RepID=A0ABV3GHC4_MICGL